MTTGRRLNKITVEDLTRAALCAYASGGIHMLKRKRIGLIVWGVILTVFGFFMLLGSGEILQNVYKLQ